MKILFISAEVVPFAKRGGLGDVMGAFPKALAQLGHDVRVVFPAYEFIEQYNDTTESDTFEAMPFTLTVPVRDSAITAGVLKMTLPDCDVPAYAIAEKNILGRPRIYDYDDDAYRFAFFSRAALDLTKALDWQPDIVHAHDWHCAPAIFWLATTGQSDPWFRPIQTVYTIHNLSHQGKTDWDITNYLNIDTQPLREEHFSEINMMARGIYHAGRITTVSPTYAKEIMTWEGGSGMHNLLQHRIDHVHGILNGIDTVLWDPAADTRLPQHFDRNTISRKQAVRHILQDRSGLPRLDNVPIIGVVTRLAWQKGIDMLGHVLHRLLNGEAGDAQFVILGTGEEQYENMLELFATHYPGKMAAYLEYNDGFAPMIYGGCDMFLMPSLFEPCGLGQMIAMRYGTVPIVRGVGGLLDTVIDGETGFVFDQYDSNALWETLCRAITLFNTERTAWHTLVQNGMAQDFAWDKSARTYEALYRELIA